MTSSSSSSSSKLPWQQLQPSEEVWQGWQNALADDRVDPAVLVGWVEPDGKVWQWVVGPPGVGMPTEVGALQEAMGLPTWHSDEEFRDALVTVAAGEARQDRVLLPPRIREWTTRVPIDIYWVNQAELAWVGNGRICEKLSRIDFLGDVLQGKYDSMLSAIATPDAPNFANQEFSTTMAQHYFKMPAEFISRVETEPTESGNIFFFRFSAWDFLWKREVWIDIPVSEGDDDDGHSILPCECVSKIVVGPLRVGLTIDRKIGWSNLAGSMFVNVTFNSSISNTHLTAACFMNVNFLDAFSDMELTDTILKNVIFSWPYITGVNFAHCLAEKVNLGDLLKFLPEFADETNQQHPSLAADRILTFAAKMAADKEITGLIPFKVMKKLVPDDDLIDARRELIVKDADPFDATYVNTAADEIFRPSIDFPGIFISDQNKEHYLLAVCWTIAGSSDQSGQFRGRFTVEFFPVESSAHDSTIDKVREFKTIESYDAGSTSAFSNSFYLRGNWLSWQELPLSKQTWQELKDALANPAVLVSWVEPGGVVWEWVVGPPKVGIPSEVRALAQAMGWEENLPGGLDGNVDGLRLTLMRVAAGLARQGRVLLPPRIRRWTEETFIDMCWLQQAEVAGVSYEHVKEAMSREGFRGSDMLIGETNDLTTTTTTTTTADAPNFANQEFATEIAQHYFNMPAKFTSRVKTAKLKNDDSIPFPIGFSVSAWDFLWKREVWIRIISLNEDGDDITCITCISKIVVGPRISKIVARQRISGIVVPPQGGLTIDNDIEGGSLVGSMFANIFFKSDISRIDCTAACFVNVYFAQLFHGNTLTNTILKNVFINWDDISDITFARCLAEKVSLGDLAFDQKLTVVDITCNMHSILRWAARRAAGRNITGLIPFKVMKKIVPKDNIINYNNYLINGRPEFTDPFDDAYVDSEETDEFDPFRECPGIFVSGQMVAGEGKVFRQDLKGYYYRLVVCWRIAGSSDQYGQVRTSFIEQFRL